MGVGETALSLTRVPEPECESSPVSALSASASGACESRERRRRTLLDGDCSFSDKGDKRCGCCCFMAGANFVPTADATVPPESRVMTSSSWPSSLPESTFTSAADDMDDCERRGLPDALGSEEDVVAVVVVEEMEFVA